MITFGLIGAGGMGREQIFHARQSLAHHLPNTDEDHLRIVFVESAPSARHIEGFDVVSMDDFLALPGDEAFYSIAIADSYVREKVADEIARAEAQPVSLIHPTADIRPYNDIAPGAIFSMFTIATSGIRIGRFFQALAGATIGHDSTIGDFCFMAVRTVVNGNVVVGNHVNIGTGAIIKNGTPDKPLTIGDGATIGMGAVVLEDVPAGATVAGNPARLLSK